ncbi:hypothetical protein HHI36_023008 [Cryptolaemus montrouzieri]|uniref:Serpin domain-containing protein n=1 Tax=Cryptolaemus montrouzieri TaxID=559131 RepID=A0ABD2PGN1_9CUCU
MSKILVSCLSFLLLASIRAQNEGIGDSLNKFAARLLQVTANEAGDKMNLALSPYTVWSLLSIITEGARENTASELEAALEIPKDKSKFREEYGVLRKTLLKPTEGVTLELSSGIFTNKIHPLKKKFRQLMNYYYNVDITPVDFRDTKASTDFINKYVADATKNRIPNLLLEGDVQNAEIFLTSTLYFKGDWKLPFNKTATQKVPFFDEKNAQIGQVDMMFTKRFVPFSKMDEIKSSVVLLPYGDGNKMSMIVILPKKGSSVSEVLELLIESPMTKIYERLRKEEQQYYDDEINIYLPKFSISSDLNLMIALYKMGVKDVFDFSTANLLDMVDQYLFISGLIQKAEIEVNEEGTVASAAAGASAIYKQQTPNFIANRPFIYALYDSEAKSVIFNGIYRTPQYSKLS